MKILVKSRSLETTKISKKGKCTSIGIILFCDQWYSTPVSKWNLSLLSNIYQVTNLHPNFQHLTMDVYIVSFSEWLRKSMYLLVRKQKFLSTVKPHIKTKLQFFMSFILFVSLHSQNILAIKISCRTCCYERHFEVTTQLKIYTLT